MRNEFRSEYEAWYAAEIRRARARRWARWAGLVLAAFLGTALMWLALVGFLLVFGGEG